MQAPLGSSTSRIPVTTVQVPHEEHRIRFVKVMEPRGAVSPRDCSCPWEDGNWQVPPPPVTTPYPPCRGVGTPHRAVVTHQVTECLRGRAGKLPRGPSCGARPVVSWGQLWVLWLTCSAALVSPEWRNKRLCCCLHRPPFCVHERADGRVLGEVGARGRGIQQATSQGHVFRAPPLCGVAGISFLSMLCKTPLCVQMACCLSVPVTSDTLVPSTFWLL